MNLGRVRFGAAFLFCAVNGGCIQKRTLAPPDAEARNGPPLGGNLVHNADFDGGVSLPWTTSFTAPGRGAARARSGAFCVTVEAGGANPWDAQFRHRAMVAEQGHDYTLQFRIWSNKVGMARVKWGMSGPPYAEYFHRDVPLSPEPKTVSYSFRMNAPTDPTVELAFHLGGALAARSGTPFEVCIDDVYLVDPTFVAPQRATKMRLPRLRVNQVGYFPRALKFGTFVSDSKEKLEFSLVRLGSEEVVFTGSSTPFGYDSDSGEEVHLLDFSPFTSSGSSFVLVVGDQKSPAFAIQDDIYARLKYDALHYFYHNRSGIEIALPYAVEAQWARPAGHAKSDRAVPCAKDAGCSYELDVSGGWYDAGDHGKYVVNGGISVWTMLNQYEWFAARGLAGDFVDGKLNLPERNNGVPDLLDEARFEMEFLLKMQVPEGKPKAGMVHHKIHDENWTSLGIRPDEAERIMRRVLRPVSTAATLNLAATAAQSARLFKTVDPKFASRALAAAERAYAAALQYPKVLALGTDSIGGGPYDDDEVEDDFFWAAAELFLTTKKPEYKKALLDSPYWAQMTEFEAGVPSPMTWAQTATLGKLSFLTVGGVLTPEEMSVQKAQILHAADAYVALIDQGGYRVPFGAGLGRELPWGSNSQLLNVAIVLAYAHVATSRDVYLEAVVLAMDSILGRNALAQSYVTGYGTNPLRNPHHRFWAAQADSRYPSPPPGAVSGGPNSSLQDPYSQAAGLTGCAPQKCFVDHIEAYSVNEITINWNAPLAWVTAFLDAYGPRATGAFSKKN